MDSQLSTFAEPAAEDRNWGMAAHLSALVAIVGLPFGHMIGPLVVLLARGKESPFVAQHARASLNYQISLTIYITVGVIVAIVVFGAAVLMAGLAAPHHDTASGVAGIGIAVLWVAVIVAVVASAIASLIFIILGAVAANAGKPYTYPFAIPFIR